MNVNDIPVSADGFVHVGRNEWASLADIQRAVEQKTNPEAVHALTDNQAQMEHRLPNQSQLNILQPQSEQWSEERVLNLLQEDLPLPSTLVRNDEEQQSTNEVDDPQHLPLPSTMRRVEHRQQSPTINKRECRDCQPALELPSTYRRVS